MPASLRSAYERRARMPYRYRLLTAWLGMLAISLAIAMPLASQWWSAGAGAAEPIVCSAQHAEQHAPDTGSAHHAVHLDACGYCSFFAHAPAIAVTTAGPTGTFISCHARPASLPLITAVSADRYPGAYPRAPPASA
jgi:hypothetical protein